MGLEFRGLGVWSLGFRGLGCRGSGIRGLGLELRAQALRSLGTNFGFSLHYVAIGFV